MNFLSFTFSFIFLFASLLIAQEGDKKEKNLSLLDSLNWREWSPGVVPLFTPEESLSKFKIAPGFRVELVAAEPLVKDPVFVNWDEDDEDYDNDMNVAMTGDMVIRIAQGTTVERGNLLMSAGDGTAKPQGDGYVQDKTIAKVTSTNVSHTYDDGSYLVPCVLMAC